MPEIAEIAYPELFCKDLGLSLRFFSFSVIQGANIYCINSVLHNNA